ncbi:glycoside hydrolase family 19 protein [Pedobacter sp. NJ-S-72]
MDTKKFFDTVRLSLFGGKLTISQVKGMIFILDEINKEKLSEQRFTAYMLATVFHETGKTMLPINENAKGKGYDYGKKLKRSRIPYTFPDKIYYGRGYVQLTWFENYQLMGRLLNIDLLNRPELALDPDIAARIMIEGMTRGASSFGDFTGKCLEMYFNTKVSDPIGARRIINGSDQALVIAGYYNKFLKALS